MTILLLCLAVIIGALVWRGSRVPIKHRWRRRQSRIVCEALRGRDRNQPPALIYGRLRAMDALAFEELLLESFERRRRRVIRNHRYTGDGGVDSHMMIDGRGWPIQAKRYAAAIRPAHVRALVPLCATRGVRGLFIHTGRTGETSRDIIDWHGAIEIVSGQRLLALTTGAQLVIGRRQL